MPCKWHTVLVLVGGLEVAGVGRGHPVRRADKCGFGEDVVTTLLLAIRALRDIDGIDTLSVESVGFEMGTCGISEGAVGVGREDGVDLGRGQVGELDLEPPKESWFVADDWGDEEGPLVGVVTDEKLLAVDTLGAELLGGPIHDVGVVGDGVKGPDEYERRLVARFRPTISIGFGVCLPVTIGGCLGDIKVGLLKCLCVHPRQAGKDISTARASNRL